MPVSLRKNKKEEGERYWPFLQGALLKILSSLGRGRGGGIFLERIGKVLS